MLASELAELIKKRVEESGNQEVKVGGYLDDAPVTDVVLDEAGYFLIKPSSTWMM